MKTTINAGFNHKQKNSKSMSHEETSANSFFNENGGEIHIGNSVCYSDDLRIVANVRPKFSVEFLQGRY